MGGGIKYHLKAVTATLSHVGLVSRAEKGRNTVDYSVQTSGNINHSEAPK